MTLTETKYNYKIKRHVLPFLPHPSPWEKKKKSTKDFTAPKEEGVLN